jgi:iron complex outermembrane receptor protein
MVLFSRATGGARRYPATLLLCALTSGLSAQEDTISEDVFFSEIPKVRSASRMEQKITEAPVAITIIDREMIRASGAIELAQVLQLVPGFFSYHVFGNQFGVVSRTPSSDFPGGLEVMINRRSVYQPMFSSVEWTSLGVALDEIEYIEVLRGPASSVYGTNAFAGAINIVTRTPLAAPRHSVVAEAGSLDTRNLGLSSSLALGDIDSRLHLHYRHNDGFPANSDVDDSIWPVSKVRDGRETWGLSWDAFYVPSLSQELSFRAGIVESDVELPSADIDGYSTREHLTTWQQFNWLYRADSSQQLFVQAYHNRIEFEQTRQLGLLSYLTGIPPELTEPLLGQPDQLLRVDIDDALSESFDLEVQHDYAGAAGWRANWGVGLRHQRIRSEYLLDQSGKVDDTAWRGFFNWQWQASRRLHLNAGAMLEDNGIVGTNFSPRAALNIALANNHVLRTGLSRGHRSPSLLEENQFQVIRFADGTAAEYEVISGADLQEAEITSYELAYLWNTPQQGINFELRAYFDDADNGPGTVRVPGPDGDGRVAQRDQVYDWETIGLEAQLGWQFPSGHRLHAFYAYADIDGDRRTRNDPPVYRSINDTLPAHSGGLLYMVPLRSWLEFSGFLLYRGEVDWEGGDELDAHTRLDLRLASRFEVARERLELALLAHNVIDDFQDYDQHLEFERRLYLRLAMEID